MGGAKKSAGGLVQFSLPSTIVTSELLIEVAVFLAHIVYGVRGTELLYSEVLSRSEKLEALHVARAHVISVVVPREAFGAGGGPEILCGLRSATGLAHGGAIPLLG